MRSKAASPSLLDAGLSFLSPMLIPCWMLSFALVRAVQVSLYIPGSVWLVLGISGIAVLLTSCVLHSKYAAIGVGAAAVITCLLMLIIDKGRLWKQLFTVFDWFFRYSSGLESLEGGFPTASLWIVGLVIGIAVALLGVRWVFFPGHLALSGSLILVLWILGHSEILPYALIAMIALGVGYAVSFGQYAQKHQNAKSHQHVIALWTLPVILVLSLIGYLIVSETRYLPRSNWLGTRLDVVNDYLAQYTGLVKEQDNVFSLSQVGFTPLGNRLGGPATPLPTKAFYVRASEPMLLRGTVYDEYTGLRWNKSEAVKQKRIGIEDTEEIRAETYNDGMPPSYQVPGSFYDDVTAIIYPEFSSTSSLFVPYRVGTAEPTEPMTLLIYFNTYGEVFASRPVQRGTSYSISARLPDYDHRQFGSWVNQYQEKYGDSLERNDAIYSQYTQLPDTLPESVRTYAESITADFAAPYDKAYAIMETLAREYHYTLEPEIPPADRDFVDYFIESGEGYCTYYASAMAVLGRCAGLPTRYVEGFKMPDETVKGGLYEVKLRDAHAWCEVWLDGIGWIPFDPLTMDLRETSDRPATIAPEPTMDISAMMSQEPSETLDPGMITVEDKSRPLWAWLTITGVVFAGVLTAFIILMERHTRPQRLYRKTNIGKIRTMYADILKILTYYNAELHSGETPYQYAARIDKWLYLSGNIRMKDLADIMVAISYARHTPDTGDVMTFQRFRKRLRRYTRKNMPFFYLWHYILRVPYSRRKRG